MACAGGDENGAQPVSPNVVSIAVDPKGRVRLVPGNAIGAGRMHLPSEKRKYQDEKQKNPTVHLTSVREIGVGPTGGISENLYPRRNRPTSASAHRSHEEDHSVDLAFARAGQACHESGRLE